MINYQACVLTIIPEPMVPFLCALNLRRVANEPVIGDKPRSRTFVAIVIVFVPRASGELTRVQPHDVDVFV